MQIMLKRLMSKIEYLIMPKGTKFMVLGKLGLKCIVFTPEFLYFSRQYNLTDIVLNLTF